MNFHNYNAGSEVQVYSGSYHPNSSVDVIVNGVKFWVNVDLICFVNGSSYGVVRSWKNESERQLVVLALEEKCKQLGLNRQNPLPADKIRIQTVKEKYDAGLKQINNGITAGTLGVIVVVKWIFFAVIFLIVFGWLFGILGALMRALNFNHPD